MVYQPIAEAGDKGSIWDRLGHFEATIRLHWRLHTMYCEDKPICFIASKSLIVIAYDT